MKLIKRLAEDWYRVTCNGGNNYGKAGLSFQAPGSDGKFKIGIKSKANFTKGEQVTFKTKEEAQAFAEKVLNSDIGKKRGMTKIYEPQVIKDSNADQFVEVDTIFGKAYMRSDLAMNYGYNVETYSKEIKEKIDQILNKLNFKELKQNGFNYDYVSDHLYGGNDYLSKIIIRLSLENDPSQVKLMFYCEGADKYYDYIIVGNNYEPKTLIFINNGLEKKILDALNAIDYNFIQSLPYTDAGNLTKKLQDNVYSKFPAAKGIADYVLLWGDDD